MSHRTYWNYHCNHQRWYYRNPVAAVVRLGCYHRIFQALDRLCRWLGYLASPCRDVMGVTTNVLFAAPLFIVPHPLRARDNRSTSPCLTS